VIHEPSGESENWRFEITPVESLPGSTGTKVVFGMLCKAPNGKFIIEDIHQAVPVKLEAVTSSNDFITNNTFVLGKGQMVHDVFIVSELTLPPVPRRSLCEATVNFFGGPVELTSELVVSTVGSAPADASIAVLSGVHLDNPMCLERLNNLFTGFEECDAVPAAYIFLGDFVSKPFNFHSGDSFRTLQRCFDAFSQLLARHPKTIENSQIVIIPGAGDQNHQIFPAPPFCDALLRGISSRFPNVVLGSNPCRLRFFDKQILFFAGDNIKRLRKSRIVEVKESTLETQHELLCRFLLSQMHLSPGPVTDNSVIWEYDAGLRLYPPPHCIFLADFDAHPYATEFHGETLVVGMPKFASYATSVGEFHVYSPSTNDSTLSSV
jgi:DNA polymerase epsilon subunit 2